MTDLARRDFIKRASMALAAMGLPLDALDMREPHVRSFPSYDLTTLSLPEKGPHKTVYHVTNTGPRRVRLANLTPGWAYLILVDTQRGAVPMWDWDEKMLWPIVGHSSDPPRPWGEPGKALPPTLSTEPGSFDVIYAICVASDRVLCSYSTGHR